MNRDIEVVKGILLAIEQTKAPYQLASDNVVLPGISPDQVNYHAQLLLDAGLIKGKMFPTLDEAGYTPVLFDRMTLIVKQEVLRLLHDVHEREDLGDDEETLVQIQHDVEELLSTAALLLSRDP